MILKYIKIKNIRSHVDTTFEPELQGTTAIWGEIGSGKSTIVDSLGWCLFGTRVNGIKTQEFIREGVDPKKSETSVEVLIQEGNKEYKILRKILNSSGKTECNIYSRNLDKESEEFEFECGPSVTHSESFIRNLLHIDEKGFLSSIFIQQKQVDKIILASAKERGAVIEKLIGVNAITNAIANNKEELKALQKAVEIIKVEPIEELEKTLEEQKKSIEENKTEVQKISNYVEMQKTLFEVNSKTYQEEKIRQDQYLNKNTEVLLCSNNIKNLQENLEGQLNVHNSISVENFSEDVLISMTEELTSIKKELREKDSKLFELQSVLGELNNLFSKVIPEGIETKLNNSLNLQKEYNFKLEEIQSRGLYVKDRMKHINEYIEELNKGIAVCPMCGNDIVDVEEEKEKQQKELKDFEKEIQDQRIQYSDYKKKKDDILKDIIDLQGIVDLKARQEKKRDLFINTKQEKELIESQITTLKEKEMNLTEQINKMNNAKKNMELIKSVKESIRTLNNQIGNKKEYLKSLEIELNSIQAMEKSEFNKLEKLVNDLNREIQTQELQLVSLKGKIESDQRRVEDLTLQIEKQSKALLEHTKLMEQIAKLNLSIQSLNGFKEERIAESTPKLEEIVSEILYKFTEGDFREVKISKSFDVSVIERNGFERRVSQLSGGEMSSVAIALSLGIAVFLHNGTPNLLILDESLASMSEDRSRLMLETITTLPQSQIIFITHSSVINGYADKVFSLS